MSFVDLKWQKSEKNRILDFFDKFQYIYEKPFVGQKKVVKQKMEGGKSFVAPPSV